MRKAQWVERTISRHHLSAAQSDAECSANRFKCICSVSFGICCIDEASAFFSDAGHGECKQDNASRAFVAALNQCNEGTSYVFAVPNNLA